MHISALVKPIQLSNRSPARWADFPGFTKDCPRGMKGWEGTCKPFSMQPATQNQDNQLPIQLHELVVANLFQRFTNNTYWIFRPETIEFQPITTPSVSFDEYLRIIDSQVIALHLLRPQSLVLEALPASGLSPYLSHWISLTTIDLRPETLDLEALTKILALPHLSSFSINTPQEFPDAPKFSQLLQQATQLTRIGLLISPFDSTNANFGELLAETLPLLPELQVLTLTHSILLHAGPLVLPHLHTLFITEVQHADFTLGFDPFCFLTSLTQLSLNMQPANTCRLLPDIPTSLVTLTVYEKSSWDEMQIEELQTAMVRLTQLRALHTSLPMSFISDHLLLHLPKLQLRTFPFTKLSDELIARLDPTLTLCHSFDLMELMFDQEISMRSVPQLIPLLRSQTQIQDLFLLFYNPHIAPDLMPALWPEFHLWSNLATLSCPIWPTDLVLSEVELPRTLVEVVFDSIESDHVPLLCQLLQLNPIQELTLQFCPHQNYQALIAILPECKTLDGVMIEGSLSTFEAQEMGKIWKQIMPRLTAWRMSWYPNHHRLVPAQLLTEELNIGIHLQELYVSGKSILHEQCPRNVVRHRLLSHYATTRCSYFPSGELELATGQSTLE